MACKPRNNGNTPIATTDLSGRFLLRRRMTTPTRLILGDSVHVTAPVKAQVVKRVAAIMGELRPATFTPKQEKKKCNECEFRRLCDQVPVDPWESDD